MQFLVSKLFYCASPYYLWLLIEQQRAVLGAFINPQHAILPLYSLTFNALCTRAFFSLALLMA